ncbi:MAG: TrkH family potassium uptake protein [Oscillospiraceae bacterium]|nr:TrkH family potassium uptake protein [Oscillospiraceae bacterium]MBQ7130693.1 TrkH family potassium uptake protein [Oscillospiraceae bacterium]
MNFKMMGRFIAQILSIEGFFMLPALLISLSHGEDMAVKGFLVALAAIGVGVLSLSLICRGAPSAFYAKEGLVCVGASWIAMSLAGCLPFWVSREIPVFIDAFFEIVSGFTTTGASILPEVESLSKGILYWRSFSHWLGGMGVLVFLLAFTGGKGQGFTMHLLRAESPGPNVGKLVPKMRTTAAILYIIYVILTILNILFLWMGDMPLFDSVCHAFGTAGTGGFGIKNDSFTSYSPYLQNVTTVFMILFGVNFSCYYLLLIREWKSVIRDEELRTYFCIILASVALIVWNTRGLYGTLEETIRHAAFQVASLMTTTGYATADFDLWPSFSKTILLCLMVVGACAGSTGGGLKVGRAMLIFKSLGRNIRQVMKPRKVMAVRNNGLVVPEKVLDNTNAYLSAYIIILFFSFLLISLDGFSTGTNFSAILACFNNIGPGLEAVGPTCNYSAFSDFSKLVLIVDMLAGRLEIFPILVLFSHYTWKND